MKRIENSKNPDRNKQAGVLICVLGLLLWISPAGSGASESEPMEEDEMVVSATTTEKLAKEAPGSVEVITGREIEEMNAETVADAVAEATSLLVTTRSLRRRTWAGGASARPS
ncbi:MAG: hypothetical protein R6X08_12465 [Desulfosalsimonadaceae bacterium]